MQGDSRYSSERSAARALPMVPRRPKKWLNLVFDLNGILCMCVDAKSSGQRKSKQLSEEGFHYNPRRGESVGPKLVFSRPKVREFLSAVREFAATVNIWSSMKHTTANQVASYLFHELYFVDRVSGQDVCRTIKFSPGENACLKNSNKPIFLKVLEETYYYLHEKKYNGDNTLLVDDSQEKSACNENGNVLILPSWSKHDKEDDFLMGELLPWLIRLHECCGTGGLRDYVNKNRIGAPPLSECRELLAEVVGYMEQAVKRGDKPFTIPSIGKVIRR